MRHLLLKYREFEKIDKHIYHDMYKNNRAHMESIHKSKPAKAIANTLSDKFEASRGRKIAHREQHLALGPEERASAATAAPAPLVAGRS